MEDKKQNTNPIENTNETSVNSTPSENSIEKYKDTTDKSALKTEEKESAETTPKEVELTTENEPDFFDRLGKKAIWLALGLAACIATYVYWDFLTFEKVLLFKDIGSDSYNFYYCFWAEISDLMKQDGIPRWSFENGMGDSMFLFYQGDPFNLFLFFLGKENLPYGLAYVEVLKILLTTFFIFKYLNKLNLNNLTCIIGSLIFGFSGWMILGTSGWYVFSTQVFYFSLIIYSLENFIINKNWILLTIAITFASISDIISCIQYGLFSIAYILIRFFEKSEYEKSQQLFKKIVVASGTYLLGIGIAGVFTVTYFSSITNSARVVGNSKIVNYVSENPLKFVSKIEGLSIIGRLFSNDLLGAGSDYKGFFNYLEGPTLYIGLLTLLFVVQGLFILPKRLKFVYGIITILIIIILIFPYFRYAFWGFQLNYYRIFSFFISFFLFYIGLKSLNHFLSLKIFHKNALIVFNIITALLLLTSFIFPEGVKDQPTSLFITIIIIGYSLLMFYGLKNKFNIEFKIGLIGILIIELLVLTGKTVNNRNHIFSSELTEKKGYNDYSLDAVKYIKSIDTSFYRIAKIFPSGLTIHQSMNDAMVQDFNGLIGYTAFHNKNYLSFLNQNDALNTKKTDDLKWVYKIISNPKLFSFAGAKYIIDKGENFNYDTTYMHCIKKMNGISIFKNDLALPLFFFQDNYIKEKDFKKLSKKNKSHALFYASVLPNESNVKFENALNVDDTIKLQNLGLLIEQAKILQQSKITTKYFSNNKIMLDVQVDQPTILQTTIPFHKGWSVLVDGKLISPFIANGGLLAFNLAKGDKQIVLEFKPTDLKLGLIVALISFIVCVCLLLKNKFT